MYSNEYCSKEKINNISEIKFGNVENSSYLCNVKRKNEHLKISKLKGSFR